ncbi:MAG: extracellular solute-binding protein, partial [Clostridia bacterium]|nr:extracellular solute-binding protein [Clostridia bacterium]
MKHTGKLWLALVLAFLLLAGIAGCGKDKTPVHGALDTTLVDAAGERYTAAPLTLPDGWTMTPGGGAMLDPESGAVLVAARASDMDTGCAVFALSTDGAVLAKTDLPAGEGQYLSASAFSGDSVWYALETADGTLLRRANRKDGTLTVDTVLRDLSGMPPSFYIDRMAADGDGDLWLVSGDTALVYTSDLRFLTEVKPGGILSCLALDPDGRIWASADYDGSSDRGAYRLNKTTGGYDEAIGLDPSNRRIAFGPDGSLYYDTREGIRCLRREESGTMTVHPVMNFLSSGVLWGEGGSLVSGDVGGERVELMLVSDGGLLFRHVDPTSRGLLCTPMWFVPAGEEADGDTVTLQLAFAQRDILDKSFIVKFNAEHPDIQINLLDYSIYSDTYNAGAEKLLLDMTTGIIRPDIVVGSLDSLEMMTLARQKRTVDLMPYLREEDKLNPDNIFGIALRFFDNGEGGLWGFTNGILPETWVSTRELLGPYGSDDGWGVEEYLDYAETLPEGRYLSQWYGMRGTMARYLPGVYESFVDLETGTCSFDSPLFVRYLRYIDNLPTAQQIQSNRPEYRENSELTRLGFYTLADCRDLTGMGVEHLFGTRDFVIVGYPSDNPAGRVKIYGNGYVIPKTAPHPDEAWEFIRALFLEPRGDSSVGYTVYKSEYDESTEAGRQWVYLHFEDGFWIRTKVKVDDYEKEADNIKAFYEIVEPGRPYTVEPPDEEQIQRIRTWLDSAGGRAIDLLPPEVNDLIREEISAWMGGVGTPEDCAEKIQSRVSIWLA